jgi:hypothetical protein
LASIPSDRAQRCPVCGRAARYGFVGANGARDFRCTRHAIWYPQVRDRAVRVAVVVGTMLFAINQLDVVITGQLSTLVAGKIALTFAVPYSVSTYSALEVNRLR